MIDAEKSGINPQWQAKLQGFRAWATETRTTLQAARLNGLAGVQHFAERGTLLPYPGETVRAITTCTPPIAQWEEFGIRDLVDRQLKTLMMEFELASRLEGRFDLVTAGRAFDIAYPAWLCELHYWYFHPVRFSEDGDDEHTLYWSRVQEIALGVVIGRRREAETLFRLLCRVTRRLEEVSRINDPLSDFMMRLMADHLGEPEIETPGFEEVLPSHARLLKVWRDPDPAAIAPLCQAACDIHTQAYGEHATLNGGFVPYEILMLFRLREWAGLANPVPDRSLGSRLRALAGFGKPAFDHPLMAPPFDRLPATSAMWSDPDPDLLAAYERMKREGFDEAAIVRMILDDEHDTDAFVLENLPREREHELALRTWSGPELGVWIDLPAVYLFGWDEVPVLSGGRQLMYQSKMQDCGLTLWGTRNPGAKLDQWADMRRREVIAQGLRPLGQGQKIEGMNWQGVLMKFRGRFAGGTQEKWVWVLCIATPQRLISADLMFTAKTWSSQYRVFEWLLRTRLGLTKDEAVTVNPETARWDLNWMYG